MKIEFTEEEIVIIKCSLKSTNSLLKESMDLKTDKTLQTYSINRLIYKTNIILEKIQLHESSIFTKCEDGHLLGS